jgi:phage shock protein A
MHNLTYQERARFAYANGNTELAEALEDLATFEAEEERLTDRVWDLEQELIELQAQLNAVKETTE